MWTCTLTLAVRSFNQVQRTLGNEVAWSLGHSFSFAATVSCDTSLRAPGPRNTGLTQDDWAGDVHLQTQRRKIRLSLQKIIRKTKRNPFICVVKQLINMINMLLPKNPDFLGGGKLHNIYKRKHVWFTKWPHLFMSTDELESLHSESELSPGAGVDLHCVVLHTPATWRSYNL